MRRRDQPIATVFLLGESALHENESMAIFENFKLYLKML